MKKNFLKNLAKISLVIAPLVLNSVDSFAAHKKSSKHTSRMPRIDETKYMNAKSMLLPANYKINSVAITDLQASK